MKRIEIIFLLIVTMLFGLSVDNILADTLADSVSIVCDAGELSKKITGSARYTIKKLKIKGGLNATDFGIIRMMAGRDWNGEQTPGKLEVLDISEVILKPNQDIGCSYRGDSYSTDYRILSDYILPRSLFEATTLKSIICPPQIHTLSGCCFINCNNLESVVAPGVREIGQYAFENCINLLEFDSSNDETTYETVKIGKYCFKGCSKLKRFAFKKSEKMEIGAYAFYDCTSLKTICINADKFLTIGESGFKDCVSLESVQGHYGFCILKGSAFKNCKNLSNFSPNVDEVGDSCFANCEKINELPNNYYSTDITQFGKYSYSNTGFVDLELWGDGGALGEGMFQNCKHLKTIVSYKSIPKNCFDGCTNLEFVKIGSASQIGEDAFDESIYNSCSVRVPKGEYYHYVNGVYGKWYFKNTYSEDVLPSPTISVDKNNNVSIRSYVYDGTLYYHPKGYYPSYVYSEPFQVSKNTVVSALVELEYDDAGHSYHGSNPVGGPVTYTINSFKYDIPTIEVKNNIVTITAKDSLNIDYAINREPTHNTNYTNHYTKPFEISERCTIYAKVYIDARNYSETASYQVRILKLSAPKINCEHNVVTMSSPEDADIFYTVDGTEPNVLSSLYKEPIRIDKDLEIRAFAVKDEFESSEKTIAKCTYEIGILKLSAPKINCEHNVVTMSSHEDADIFYTVDGTEPNVHSSLYKEPIRIDKNLEIRAFAVKDGYENSEVTIVKCTYVSRTQTITWGEMKAPSVGETIELMATASSGLSVKYSAYAPLSAFKEPIINVNKATFPQEGCYLLVATQEGNEDYDMVADTLQINVVCDDDELMCFDGIYYKLTASKEALKVVRGNLPYKGKVVIPATVNGMPVVEIENNAMYASYFLTEVTIGENISVFGSQAIGACPNLHTIVLPANAALRLPSYCFNCDDKVREIHCLSEDPYVVAESVFNGFLDYEKCVLYVPVGCRNKYIQAPFWKNFTHIEESTPIIVRAKSYSRQYGDENPVFEFDTEGAALDGTPEIVCSAVADSPVGSYTIEVKQGSIKNYNVHFESGSLVITKAPLSISAGNYTKKQGDAMPVFKASYAGFKNGENESVLTKQPVFSCEANEASAPAEYAVTISGADAENYGISYEQGVLTVTGMPKPIISTDEATLRITTETDNAVIYYTLDGTEPNENARKYTEPINLYASCEIKAIAVKGDAKSEVSSAEYHDAEYPNIVKVGDIITANIINNGEENLPMIFKVTSVYPFNVEMENKEDYVEGWNNERDVSGTLEIPVVVKSNGISYCVKKLGDNSLARCVNVSSLKLNEGLESIGYQAIHWCRNIKELIVPNSVKEVWGAFLTEDHGLVSVVLGSGLETIHTDAFWGVSMNLNSFISLSTNPAKCVEPDRTFTSLPEDVTLYVPLGSKSAYETAPGWDYFAGHIVEMDMSPATVKVKDCSREYGDDNPTFEIETEGAALIGEPEIICSADKNSKVGTYEIEINKGTIKNYYVTFVPGSLTVTKAPLVVTADNYTITQGDKLPEFTASYSGFKNGEDVPVLPKQPVFSCEANEASAPGKYPITVYDVEADNYEVKSYIAGTLTVLKRELKKQTITWDQEIKAKVGSTIEMNATASSGLPVRYSYALVPRVESAYRVPQIEGNNITFPEEGTYLLVAIQDGNNEYAAATDTLDVCAISDDEGLMYIDGIYYKYTDDGSALKVVRGYNPYRGKVEIPAIVNGLPVTEVDGQAMYACYYLKELVIGDNVKKCGHEAFGASINLCNVTLPVADVEFTHNWMFNCDRGIRVIHCRSSIPYVVDEGIFNGAVDYDKCILYVPVGTKQSYANSEVWKNFTHIVEENVSTNISNINVEKKGVWHTLQGVKLFAKPNIPGVYIHNGKKIIVR